MSEEEKDKVFKEIFDKTLEKFKGNPNELFNDYEITKKYNNAMRENEKLKKQILKQNKVYSDLEDKYITLKSIIKEIDDYCVKTNGTDRQKKNLDYNYICGWNAGKDEVCTAISFILDKENKQ